MVEFKKNCEVILVIVAVGRQFFKGDDEDSTSNQKDFSEPERVRDRYGVG